MTKDPEPKKVIFCYPDMIVVETPGKFETVRFSESVTDGKGDNE